MNITSEIKMKLSITIFLVLLICNSIFAKEATQSSINLQIGMAYSYNLTSELQIEGIDYDNSGFAFFVRGMLQSEYFLSIGVESGFVPIKNIYNKAIQNEFGSTNVKSNLDAIPILLVFGMDFEELKIYYGLGYYNIIARISAFEEMSRSSDFSLGFMFASEYNILKYKSIYSDIFLKIYQISDANRTILNAGISFNYKF